MHLIGNESNQSVPLKSVTVTGNISNFLASVTVTQEYVNATQTPVEVRYTFKLDNNATVTGLKLTTADKTLVGKVQEKSEAKSTYTSAVSNKQKTVLLQKLSNDVYQVDVGNMKPNENVVVEFTYITHVLVTESGYKFILPTNIAPVYTGSSDHSVQDLLNEQTFKSLSYKTNVPYVFNFDMTWTTSNEITSVESYTTTINTTNLERNKVHVTTQTSPQNGDFNLCVETKVSPTIYHYGDTTGRYLAVLHQLEDLNVNKYPKTFTFVLDCSGSMETDNKMRQAKQALEVFVRSLSEGCHFNVYRFGSSYNSMWPESKLYTEQSQNECLQITKYYQANMGGTEIYRCLEDILSKKTNGQENVIVLLTDGQVSNIKSIETLLTTHANKCRVFSVGIGSDASRDLIQTMSNSTGGTYKMVIDEKKLEEAVIDLLCDSQKQYYGNIKVKAGNTELSHKYSVLYPNQCFSTFTKVSDLEFTQMNSITIEATDMLTTQQKIWEMPVNQMQYGESYLRQFYAQYHINDLMTSDTTKNMGFGYNAGSKRVLSELTKQIVSLSVEYNVMNEYTSFVLVDASEVVNGTSTHVTVPQYRESDVQLESCRSFGARPAAAAACGSLCTQSMSMPMGMSMGMSTMNRGIQELCEMTATLGVSNTTFGMSQPAAAAGSSRSRGFGTAQSKSVTKSRHVEKALNALGLTAAGGFSSSEEDEPEDEEMGFSLYDDAPIPKKSTTNSSTNSSTNSTTLHGIVKYKNIDGSYKYNKESCQVAGTTMEFVESRAKLANMTAEIYFQLVVHKLLTELNKQDRKYTMMITSLADWLQNKNVTVTTNMSVTC